MAVFMIIKNLLYDVFRQYKNEKILGWKIKYQK